MTRDLVGYGRHIPTFSWPNKARLAINFVVNYEEGAELTPLNGDEYAEQYGGEFTLAPKQKGQRNVSMESLFEYGSRVGIWRLIRLFDRFNLPITFFATGYALSLNLELVSYIKSSNHEVAGHGWRWIDYAPVTKTEEKKHIQTCVSTIKALTGQAPKGWYTGRRSEHTTELLNAIGGFVYSSDSYADDLPYVQDNLLIIPYTLDCNDFRYSTNPGFSTADDFFCHLKNTFLYLYTENRPSVMTIGLHPRLSGRPGRCIAIQNFIEFIQTFPDVWITKRIDIANHWLELK